MSRCARVSMCVLCMCRVCMCASVYVYVSACVCAGTRVYVQARMCAWLLASVCTWPQYHITETKHVGQQQSTTHDVRNGIDSPGCVARQNTFFVANINTTPNTSPV